MKEMHNACRIHQEITIIIHVNFHQLMALFHPYFLFCIRKIKYIPHFLRHAIYQIDWKEMQERLNMLKKRNRIVLTSMNGFVINLFPR